MELFYSLNFSLYYQKFDMLSDPTLFLISLCGIHMVHEALHSRFSCFKSQKLQLFKNILDNCLCIANGADKDEYIFMTQYLCPSLPLMI